MTSVQMRVAAGFVRLAYRRHLRTAAAARKRLARRKPPARPPVRLLRRYTVTVREVAGREVYTVVPRDRSPTRAAVYLHGGAYYGEIAADHWDLVADVAAAGARVDVPIYGLAPDHTYREAYPFITAAYRDLLADADPQHVSVVGDSAGGGLALGLVQTLAGLNLPPPRRLVLISPWLDLALADPQVEQAQRQDPWLGVAGLREAGLAWAGGDDVHAPLLSPINGPMDQLPRTEVYIGTRDLFYPDVVRLQQLAAAAGAYVRLHVRPGAIHVYPLVPAPEGRAARTAIIADVCG